MWTARTTVAQKEVSREGREPGGAAAGAQGAGNINEILVEAASQQQKLVVSAPEQAERPQLVPDLWATSRRGLAASSPLAAPLRRDLIELWWSPRQEMELWFSVRAILTLVMVYCSRSHMLGHLSVYVGV